MASHLIFLCFLLTTATISAIAPLPSPSPSSTPPPPPPPPPPSPSPLPPPNHQLQFNALLDALIGAGDFTNWANLLAEAADPTIIPISATFFVPDDDAFLTRPPPERPLNFLDPLLFPYHILPRRLSFAALRLFPAGTRLPTLLPGFSLLIKNHSAANFTVSGARVTWPDLYQTSLISVHGVGSVLDYTLFGRDAPPPTPPLLALNDVSAGDSDSLAAKKPTTNLGLGFVVGCFIFILLLGLCFMVGTPPPSPPPPGTGGTILPPPLIVFPPPEHVLNDNDTDFLDDIHGVWRHRWSPVEDSQPPLPTITTTTPTTTTAPPSTTTTTTATPSVSTTTTTPAIPPPLPDNVDMLDTMIEQGIWDVPPLLPSPSPPTAATATASPAAATTAAATSSSSTKGQSWTLEEHSLLMFGYDVVGTSWTNISKDYVRSRTARQCQDRYRWYLQKKGKGDAGPELSSYDEGDLRSKYDYLPHRS